MPACNICKNDFGQPLFVSPSDISITSLCEIIPKSTKVYLCDYCGHLQTIELDDINDYYDKEYKILIDSEEEDQLYKLVNGVELFRFDHQVNILLEKANLPINAAVLDYGCAKATSLKKLLDRRNDIVGYVYDVSDMYVSFWNKFIPLQNQGLYSVPDEWQCKFDLVTSYFVLEHVAQPRTILRDVHSLLRDNGRFHFVVPNVITNIADFVVADHINHFTKSSLTELLKSSEFTDFEIDDTSHDGAFVVTASKSITGESSPQKKCTHFAHLPKIHEIAEYWKAIARQIVDFERQNQSVTSVAIYGAGFYGTYISTCLSEFSKVECFIDSNPHLQGKKFLNKPIIPPTADLSRIEIMYVGLNPENARGVIESISEWSDEKFDYCFL